MSYNLYAGKQRTNSNIAWHRPQSSGSRVEEELMQKSRRALETTADPLEKLRLLCLARGAAGIMVVARIFRKIDEEGSNQINKEQFHSVIKDSGLELTDQEIDEVFARFDMENSGSIRLDDFIKDIRPPMSESRRSIVEQAFRKFDHHGHNMVTVQDLRDVFAVTSNSRYMTGEDSAATVMSAFLDNFETDGEDDGKVTLEEFMSYYAGISVSIPDDCYFDLMMRQAYKL